MSKNNTLIDINVDDENFNELKDLLKETNDLYKKEKNEDVLILEDIEDDVKKKNVEILMEEVNISSLTNEENNLLLTKNDVEEEEEEYKDIKITNKDENKNVHELPQKVVKFLSKQYGLRGYF
jgi:hypothetical protein